MHSTCQGRHDRKNRCDLECSRIKFGRDSVGRRGQGGSLNSSASALNFGGVAVGTSKVLTVRLAAGASNVTIASATSTSPEFHLSELSLPMTIAAGQTASVSLIFTPQSSGATSGNISFAGDSADTLMVESLTGSGMAGSSHTVRLQWNPAPTKVKGYNVYRSSTPGGPYQKINPQVNSNPELCGRLGSGRRNLLLRQHSGKPRRKGKQVFKPVAHHHSHPVEQRHSHMWFSRL